MGVKEFVYSSVYGLKFGLTSSIIWHRKHDENFKLSKTNVSMTTSMEKEKKNLKFDLLDLKFGPKKKQAVTTYCLRHQFDISELNHVEKIYPWT